MAFMIILCFMLIPFSEGFLEYNYRTPNKTLNVNNGGVWGDWLNINYCPTGTFAVGYEMKIEGQLFSGDDTALNGVKLRCGDIKGHLVSDIESAEGDWGLWTEVISCNNHTGQNMSHDFIVAFQLQVERDQGSYGDDTAANYMKVRCRDSTSGNEYEVPGKSKRGFWGDFGDWSESCDQNSAVCGIQDRLESQQGSGDDTSLNDLKLYCCDIN